MSSLLALSWSYPNGSNALLGMLFGTVVVGFLILFLLTKAPPRYRRLIVGIFTFISGAIYVAYFLWPTAQSRSAGDVPLNAREGIAFWLQDAVGAVGGLSTTLTAFLLGLGIYSLIRIHTKRIFSGHRDAIFSICLLLSMLAIVVFGYWNYYDTKYSAQASLLQFPENWHWQHRTYDFLFDGLLQQMDSAMFSIIAFFILSAAYRAFRIRSIEATILLSAALIVMLGLMGGISQPWGNTIDHMTGGDPGGFLNNFKLTEIRQWIQDTLQTPGIRALDFGIGLGALAMGLRLWLSLEKGGVSA